MLHSRFVWSLDGWILDDFSMEVFYDACKGLAVVAPKYSRKRDLCPRIDYRKMFAVADECKWEHGD